MKQAALNKNSRPRRIVFTLNNWTEAERSKIRSAPHVRAGIIGKEVGESGTPHLQGALLFSKAIVFSTIKALMPRAHIEVMRGQPNEAFEYCRKDKDFEEWGDLPKPGKRNDLKTACDKLKDGGTLMDLVHDDTLCSTFVRNHKGLVLYQDMINRSIPLRTKTIIWLYGETGVGKTRKAMEVGGLTSYWISNENLKWFDGYASQEVVILDDLRTNHCSFSFLLRILDRYEVDVPIKGGFVRWNPSVIFITAPMPPKLMFDLKKEGDVAQLTRRCTHILKVPDEINHNVFVGLKKRFAPKPIGAPDVAEEDAMSVVAPVVAPPPDVVDLVASNESECSATLCFVCDSKPCKCRDGLEFPKENALHWDWCYHCRSSPCGCYEVEASSEELLYSSQESCYTSPDTCPCRSCTWYRMRYPM